MTEIALSHSKTEQEKMELQLERNFILRSTSRETRRNYRAALEDFARFCCLRHRRKISLTEVSFSDVQAWRDAMISQGKSPHTVCTKLAALRSLFEFGRALGFFQLNPAATKLVPPPQKPAHSSGRALSSREVRIFLSWFRVDNLLGARDYAICLLMVRLALRVSEVCSLRVSAIKWKSGRWILTVKVKGGRIEERPLPDDVKRAIDNYLQLDRQNREILRTNNEDAFIFQAFPTQRFFGVNRSLSVRHVWYLVKKYANLSGLGDLSPHDLRRTAITRAFKQNIPIHQIQRMSGHKDLNTLRRYDLDRENLEDNAINKLDYNND